MRGSKIEDVGVIITAGDEVMNFEELKDTVGSVELGEEIGREEVEKQDEVKQNMDISSEEVTEHRQREIIRRNRYGVLQ